MSKSNCKKCGMSLSFVSIGGKYLPRNLDGSEHYDLCSKTRTANHIKYGVAFSDEIGSGFIVCNKKMYMIKPGPVITGSNYVKADDTSVPWVVDYVAHEHIFDNRMGQ